jgi:hypothetical protein
VTRELLHAVAESRAPFLSQAQGFDLTFQQLFTILFKLPLYYFKAYRLDSSILESIFNRLNHKCLLPYSREITKEVLSVIF